MGGEISRRGFLGGLAALGIAACSGGNGSSQRTGGTNTTRAAATTTTSIPVPDIPGDPFTLGVASGDPLPDGVLLWTRLALDPTAEVSFPVEPPVPVTWEVARDDRFAQVVASGVEVTNADLGYSVHADARGLEPDREYWYRFRVGDFESTVGRTRTAPETGERLSSLTFAVTSCQAYPAGFYTTYQMLAQDADVAFVVFLGDYIYELAGGSVRSHGLGIPVTLDEFRRFYAVHHADPDLRAAHAAAPWIVTWDDHEVEDNYAGLEPGGIGESLDPEGARAAFPAKRAAAYRAWWENMPVRFDPPADDGSIRIYRSFDFGDLVRLLMVDDRQHRSPIVQGAGEGNLPRPFGGGPQLEGAFDPDRTMFGAEQEAWITEQLDASPARWNLFGQQTLMAEVDRAPDDPDKGYSMDAWDGYVAPRNRLLGHVRDAQVRNFVSLGGDIHTSAVADLRADYKEPDAPVVATELVAPSASSLELLSPELVQGSLRAPHIHLYDIEHRGYLRCTVTPERLRADFRYVSTISEPRATPVEGTSWEVRDGEPGARQV